MKGVCLPLLGFVVLLFISKESIIKLLWLYCLQAFLGNVLGKSLMSYYNTVR